MKIKSKVRGGATSISLPGGGRGCGGSQLVDSQRNALPRCGNGNRSIVQSGQRGDRDEDQDQGSWWHGVDSRSRLRLIRSFEIDSTAARMLRAVS